MKMAEESGSRPVKELLYPYYGVAGSGEQRPLTSSGIATSQSASLSSPDDSKDGEGAARSCSTTAEDDIGHAVACGEDAPDEMDEEDNESSDGVDNDEGEEEDDNGSHFSSSNDNEDGEEDEDNSKSSFEDVAWKKTIQVGADFQAKVPQCSRSYIEGLPYVGEDRLLWNPSELQEEQVRAYLNELQKFRMQAAAEKVAALVKDAAASISQWEAVVAATIDTLPLGPHVRDDEQALYTLQQCSYNVDEAVKLKGGVQQPTVTDPLSLWSEEECQNFETGLRIYGKEFFLIQQHKVRSRPIGELVQFYYIWKKTERHEAFANKARLEKKKYAMHPGTTDYVDRYLEEPDSQCADPMHTPIAASAVLSLRHSFAAAASSSLPERHYSHITDPIHSSFLSVTHHRDSPVANSSAAARSELLPSSVAMAAEHQDICFPSRESITKDMVHP